MDSNLKPGLGISLAQMQVRARAVDMLGRQQIAGVPSAIHELFKNSYDAFARNVEVDVLREQRMFVLRDNGIGMTYDDFLQRWLTVGTESKLGSKINTAPWLGEHGMQERHVLGEKGIGRLAIAIIGPAVLVLTRANRADGLHDLVAALVHWGLFEIPGVGLDRIVVPVKTFNAGTLPEKSDMDGMVDAILDSLDSLQPNLTGEARSKIEADLSLMRFSPKDVYAGLSMAVPPETGSENPSVEKAGFGTHFIIRPYDSILDIDLEDDGQLGDKRPSKLQTLLVGFANTIFPDLGVPPIKACFRDHKRIGDFSDLIDERAFICPEDFEMADHQFDGRFDEYGKFTGTVKIFNKPAVSYTLSYPASSPLQCGPFRIRFGYSQGFSHQSLLESHDHERLNAKLAKHGGLYVYRDGIRILPYGEIEHDFLRIEQRRNKAAKDWFFSFRRMLGAIILDNTSNQALREKAGREGFQENAAFRQFRAVLENFLMSLAKDFFRKDAPLGDEFNRMREEMDRQNELLKKREKQVSKKKAKLQESLDSFFKDVEDGLPKRRAEAFEEKLSSRLKSIMAYSDPDLMGRELQRAERELRDGLGSLRNGSRISRPRGIGLSKSSESDWARYRVLQDELEASIYSPLEARLQGCLAEVLKERGGAINRRLLLRDGINSRKEEMEKLVRKDRDSARESMNQSTGALQRGIDLSLQRFRNSVQDAMSDFDRTNIDKFSDLDLIDFQSSLQQKIEFAATKERDFLSHMRQQLESLSEDVSDGLLPDDFSAALEGQNNSLREDLSDAMYWAQIGMALGVVQHEFDAVARGVKKDIRNLRPWAEKTPALRGLFNGLHSGFAHLEEYLSLFTPLDRRMYRSEMELSGGEIANYIENVFSDRFDRHSIKYEATSSLLSSVILAYPSTIYPVLINIVDNACYWVSKRPEGSRWIKLGRNSDGIWIQNSGAGIEWRYAEQIFEFGFSEKQDGRGMGLAISRKSLRRDGLDIQLLNPGKENEPRFLVKVNFVVEEGSLFDQEVLTDE
ncbi:ATP-binding protein [Pseudomonas sp. GOM7]|uniref:ATP-binding protein n=1 Tax=Pseudomonas sp. GOM7 TaxID=2998079 RepID=UPI00227CDA16|nr:ATP-binding protein [Pseudomonas sp. GOM7]WAJ38603.1 ATP-binding protein [Pseudomonas sp. GOM7]